jgi:hypothetical protein
MGGSSNSSTGKGKQGKAGKAKKTASKGKKPAGNSVASVGAQVERKPRAGNFKASVEDLVGLCNEVGLFFWKVFFKIRAQPLTAHDALLCHKY